MWSSGKSVARFDIAQGLVSLVPARMSVRENPNFGSRFNGDSAVQSPCEKYFTSVFQHYVIVSHRPALTGGALRDRHGR